ncbi:hypothetical protein [Herbaspirillum rhizosphaerae]|uniref:hypothetical protein n=1 Tax=Herbaspirillum rhizosphaerae TaxID=346179 RepID=UPI000AA205AF|nr:hypothetical protein [Herbaspirillum rhizosphaerae]
MEWSRIFNLHTWTPLSEIDGDVEQIADGIYRVATNTYVQTQPYNKNFEEDDPRSPFVTKAYWSSSVDSLKRVVLGDPSLVSKPFEVSIPEELSFETKGEYSALLKPIPKGEEKVQSGLSIRTKVNSFLS